MTITQEEARKQIQRPSFEEIGKALETGDSTTLLRAHDKIDQVVVGPIKGGIDCGDKGKLVFVSKSLPFDKGFEKLCRVAVYTNPKRLLKKRIMQEKGFKNGKQFREWVSAERKKAQNQLEV